MPNDENIFFFNPTINIHNYMPVNQCLAHYSTDLQCVKFNLYFSTFVIICVCTRSTNNLFTAGCHILCSSFEIPFEDADPNSLKPLFS